MKKALSDALADRGYTDLTPVQTAVLDPELSGRDLLVSAQTGSGKTVGFGLAIAPVLLGDAEGFDPAGVPLALVIAPTRELALQVKRELSWLYAKAGAVMASCVGGMDMRDERRTLARGAHVVVATPGRLRDHIMRGSIDLSGLRAVVLDEADEMLDLGFREDLEFILGEAPEQRQTLMFSATVPNAITGLARSYQKDAARVIAKSEEGQHADIEYRAMMVSDRDTENAVINTLRFYEAPNAIVFGNTRAMVNRLTTRLSNRGFQVVALSGELSQSERTHALQAMRDGRAQVCVATDVAARGIDLPNLDLVVHAELPSNHETLLHRSGRTGRAGRKGVSALIVTKKVRKKAERILSMARLKAEWTGAPSAGEVRSRDEARMLADQGWTTPMEETEQDTVDKLMSEFSGAQIAVAYLRLYRAMHTAPEELSEVDAKPAPRVEFGPSVWFAVSGGRAADAEPRRLLPMLCRAGDLTKDDIGAIRIQQDQSFVQIREVSVAGFLAAVGPGMTLEQGATLTRLNEPPVLERMSKPPFKATAKPKGKPGDRRGARPDGPGEARADARPAPRREKPQARAPEPVKPTPPVEWNDDPLPRVKKPKPAVKGGAGKPRDKGRSGSVGHKPAGRKPGFKPARKPARTTDPKADGSPGGHSAPRRQPAGGKPSGAANPSQSLKKGPPPPRGKPSSKKNRARAAMAAKNKGAPKRRG